MIKRLAHVGIATRSLAVAIEFYRSIGLEVQTLEVVSGQKVKIAVMKIGDSALELLEATEEDSPISRFIEKRGEGVHHIAFEVEDLEQQLEQLKKQNVKLIDERPRLGADGLLIAFIHPHSTGGVLVELTQSVSQERE